MATVKLQPEYSTDFGNNNNNANSMDQLLYQLHKISMETLDSALSTMNSKKNRLAQHRLKEPMFAVLCEIKNKISPSIRKMPAECVEDGDGNHEGVGDNSSTEKLNRLDKMLLAKGVIGPVETLNTPPVAANVGESHAEYRQKLLELRHAYSEGISAYQWNFDQFKSHVLQLLEQQAVLRPITRDEMHQMVRIIQRKFTAIEVQLKDTTCNEVMDLEKRFLDARFTLLDYIAKKFESRLKVSKKEK